MAAVTPQQMSYAIRLGNMHPAARTQAIAAVHPAHIQAIMSNPTAAAAAGLPTSLAGPGGAGGSGPDQVGATDPSGVFNPNRSVGYGARANMRRAPEMRHQILGFQTLALTSGGGNQVVKAKPQVSFKPLRMILLPSIISTGLTIGQMLVGTTSQTAGNTLFPADVFGPTSYAGDVDFSLCGPAIDITLYVNATSAVTWNAGLVGLVKSKPIRPQHTKVQALGLTPQVLAPGQSVTVTYNPQLDYVPRKIALTPGATFADGISITNVQCGQMLQTASPDPYPAALHSDLFPLDLDWDLISAAVALQFSLTNLSGASPCTFQGVVHGDVDPAQLSKAAGAYV